MMKNIFCAMLFFSVCQLFGLSQPPPPMVMASEENQKLIDKIIEITKVKEYYNTTCLYYIDRAAELNDWEEADILKRKQRMDVNRFIRMNFYNSMANYSVEELKEIFAFLQKINKRNSYVPFFLINQSIENNLRIEINSIIE